MPRRPPPKPRATRPMTLRDLQRAHNVELEQIHAEIRVISERVLDSPTRSEMNARFDDFPTRSEMNARFDDVPTRSEVNARFEQIDARFDSVDSQLRGLREEVARKADAAALAALDQRVTILERKVG